MVIFGWTIFLAPSIALLIGWFQFVRLLKSKRGRAYLPLFLMLPATIGYVWLLLDVTVLPGVLGASSSDLRVSLIVGNLAITSAITLGATLSENLEDRLTELGLARFRGYIMLMNAVTAIPWLLAYLANSTL